MPDSVRALLLLASLFHFMSSVDAVFPEFNPPSSLPSRRGMPSDVSVSLPPIRLPDLGSQPAEFQTGFPNPALGSTAGKPLSRSFNIQPSSTSSLWMQPSDTTLSPLVRPHNLGHQHASFQTEFPNPAPEHTSVSPPARSLAAQALQQSSRSPGELSSPFDASTRRQPTEYRISRLPNGRFQMKLASAQPPPGLAVHHPGPARMISQLSADHPPSTSIPPVVPNNELGQASRKRDRPLSEPSLSDAHRPAHPARRTTWDRSQLQPVPEESRTRAAVQAVAAQRASDSGQLRGQGRTRHVQHETHDRVGEGLWREERAHVEGEAASRGGSPVAGIPVQGRHEIREDAGGSRSVEGRGRPSRVPRRESFKVTGKLWWPRRRL